MKMHQKHKRKRAIPYIFSNDRLDALIWRLLEDGDPSLRSYIYRMLDNRKVFPALFIGAPSPDLLEWLRDEHNGGDFHIVIRRGRRMELSGIICICAPGG
jgi:hypothetical protein